MNAVMPAPIITALTPATRDEDHFFSITIYPIGSAPVMDKCFYNHPYKFDKFRAMSRLAELRRLGIQAQIKESRFRNWPTSNG